MGVEEESPRRVKQHTTHVQNLAVAPHVEHLSPSVKCKHKVEEPACRKHPPHKQRQDRKTLTHSSGPHFVLHLLHPRLDHGLCVVF